MTKQGRKIRVYPRSYPRKSASIYMNNLKQHLQKFFIEFEKKHTAQTCANYRFYLRRFLNWSKIISPDQITLEKIKKYRHWLENQKNEQGELLEKNTVNYHLIALRSFLKFLKQKRIETLPAKAVILNKTPKPRAEILTAAELTKLLEAPLRSNEQEIIKRRDKAILETLFSTGLKVSELLVLRKNNLNWQNKFTTYQPGNKKRRIIFSQQAKYWLKKYLDKRFDDSPWLFVSHDRAHQKKLNGLTPRSIQRIVGKYARLAKINKQITPETFRKTLEK